MVEGSVAVAEVPRVVETVLDSNEEAGAAARWQVKWVGMAAEHASWVPRRRIPEDLLVCQRGSNS